MADLIAYGTYVPRHRLARSDIAAALGAPAGKGSRTVAGYDEDTTSMGVEAARVALNALPDGVSPNLVAFATTAPAYVDKTNANGLHAALALEESIPAFDMVGAVRSGVAALWMAQAAGGLAVLSDVRTGLPGGADEATGGDAAAAFVFGEDGAIATPLAGASATGEFLDWVGSREAE